MDKVLYAVENFKNMQDLIKFADQKAGAIIVIYGFILSIAYEASKSLEFLMPSGSNLNVLGMITFMVGTILTCLILIQIYRILNNILKPRLANNYNHTETCLYYFEHVAAKDKSEIMTCFSHMDENTMLSDVASQIYEVSNTLNNKMRAVSKSINDLIYVALVLIVFMLLTRIT